MSEYGNAIGLVAGGQSQAAQQNVAASVDDDPEQASNALSLARASGVPPEVIYANPEAFERNYKSALASQIVQRNPHIQQYVNSNPMAAKVSNDDWGNLDDVSQSMRLMGKESIWDAMQRGWDENSQPSEIENTITKYFGGWSRFGGPAGPLELQRLFSGAVGAVSQAFGHIYNTATGSDQGDVYADRALQMAFDPGLAASLTGIPLPNPAAMLAGKFNLVRTPKAIEPYVNAKVPPPIGVDPFSDQIHIEQSKIDLDALKESLAAAQKSATRERDPDLFANFIRQHTDATIGIDSEAVRKLYGDTVPMPDDNLLGWAPGIEDQLIATQLGGDIHVPLADWLAKVDPDVAKELHDDIRVRANGLTLNETKEKVHELPQAKAEIGEPEEGEEPQPVRLPTTQDNVDTIRDSAGLRLFEQREAEQKLALQKVSQGTGRFANVHDYDFVNEQGQTVGDVQLTYDEAKKDLHVEYVRAEGGPNAFGPKTTRDILRQLKQEFPEAKTISGTRVSGAREEAARGPTGELPGDFAGQDVTVPLRQAEEHFPAFAEERGGWKAAGTEEEPRWVSLTQGVQIKPIQNPEEFRGTIEAVNKVLQRMAPRLLGGAPGLGKDVRAVGKLRVTGTKAFGVFQQMTDRLPYILWSVESPDAVGTIRHEIIHHLRQSGFFLRDEWETLKQAALSGGWIDKHNIRERYPDANAGLLLEESIAEEFKNWYRKNYDEATNRFAAPKGLIDKAMMKIGRLYAGLRSALKDHFDYQPNFNDIFHRVETGEIGGRRGVEPLHPKGFRPGGPKDTELRPFGQRPEEPELLGMTRMEDREIFEKASAIGMTVKQYQRVQELIAKRDREDTEFARKQNEKMVAARQTLEWREAAKRIREELRPAFRNRPDVQADEFLREGILYGEKIKGRPRLDATKLTPEQRAALPEDYVGAHGIHPDDAARLFGYPSADAMIQRVGQLVRDREAKGLGPKEHVNALLNAEVDRRMLTEHGDLAKNILEETQDHVISQTQLDLLHEQTLHMGTLAGKEVSLSKADVKQMVKQAFGKQLMDGQTVEAHLRDSLKAANLAERAYAEGDYAEAFRQQQAQYYAMLRATEAKALAKQRKQFDRNMKTMAKREVPSILEEYTNFIHQIMMKIGYGVQRSVQDLNNRIGRSVFKDLEDFWDKKTNPALPDPREMPVAEFLMDPNYKKAVSAMTVDEWRAVHETIKTLMHNGRDEKSVIVAGRKEDLAATRKAAIDQLNTLPEKKILDPELMTLRQLAKRGMKILGARLLQLESIFNRIDRGDPRGLFNKMFSYEFSEAGNEFASLTRKYSKEILTLKEHEADLNKPIPNNVFIEPNSIDSAGGEYYRPLTRRHLRGAMLNIGNESNLDKLARGYNVTKQQIMQWVHEHADKSDWDFAQAVGDLWEKVFDDASKMIESQSGLPPEKIPLGHIDPETGQLGPIKTKFGNYRGWYHKIDYDNIRPGSSKALIGRDPLEQQNYARATTPRSWEKQRTGYAAPINLNIDTLPRLIGQVLRDIAFRPVIHEASKMFYDSKFRMAFNRALGPEFTDLLVPYLQDLASTRNVDTRLGQIVDRWMEFSRQNVISTLIGMNLHTVEKHGLSALVNSIGEVGMKDFAREFVMTYASDPVTGMSNKRFAMEKSEELQRRHQQWVDTLGGAHEEAIESGGGAFARARSLMIRGGAWMVSTADLASARPTFLAEYRRALSEGSTEGEAIALGNRAVRRAHGSTALTSRPEMMRGGVWERAITSLYGFFNQMLQRQYEIGWRAKEAIGEFKQGDYDAGKVHIPKIAMLVTTSVIMPAIAEEAITGHFNEKKEGWIERAAKGIVGELSSSLPVVRDAVHALLMHHDPSIGLLSTPFQSMYNLGLDIERGTKSFSREHAGQLAKHFTSVFGMLTGLANNELGNLLKFGIDVKSGQQRPKGPLEVYRGATTGTVKEPK